MSALGIVGTAILVYLAVSLLIRVEEALNRVFGARRARSATRRLADYAAIFFLIPASIFVATAVGRWMDDQLGGFPAGADLFTLAVIFGAILAVYIVMPQRTVRLRWAAAGALFGSASWYATLRLHAAFQVGVANYSALYAGFAAVPLFLAFVLLSWNLILAGAELAAALNDPASYAWRIAHRTASPTERRHAAVELVLVVVRAFDAGIGPVSLSALASELHIPQEEAGGARDHPHRPWHPRPRPGGEGSRLLAVEATGGSAHQRDRRGDRRRPASLIRKRRVAHFGTDAGRRAGVPVQCNGRGSIGASVLIIEEHIRSGFAEVAQSRWGLVFPPSRSDRLDAAIRATAASTGESPVHSLVALRSEDPTASRAFIEALVVRETYFFRHADQIRLLTRILRARPKGRRVRVWSAGCSTGEEPYSIAIAALEQLGSEAPERVEVIATDVSDHALRIAREGCYRRWSFRDTDEITKRRWFRPAGDGWRVASAPRELIQWKALNLCGPRTHEWPTDCDIILVRNVLLYFDAEAIGRATANVAESLSPEGFLLTSPTDPDLDSLCPQLRFDPVATLYRRADALASPESGVRMTQRAVHGRRRGTQPAHGLSPVENGSPKRAAVRPEHLLARALIDGGDPDAAMRALDRLVDKNPSDGAAFALRAFLWSQRFDARAALTDAIRATDLAPELALGHWVAAKALADSGRMPAARRRLDLLATSLELYRPDQLVPLAGETTTGDLRSAAHRLLLQMTARLDKAQ